MIDNTIGFLKGWRANTGISVTVQTELGIYLTTHGRYTNVSIQEALTQKMDVQSLPVIHKLLAFEDVFVVWWSDHDIENETEQEYITYVSMDGEIGETYPLPARDVLSLITSDTGFWAAVWQETELMLTELDAQGAILSETPIDNAFDSYQADGFGFAETDGRIALAWTDDHDDLSLRFVVADCR